MAVGYWIYGNIKDENEQRDYFIQASDSMFVPVKNTMIRIANRLLSEKYRLGDNLRQHCWFAGYLDNKIYVIALAGEQEELLGIKLYDCKIRPRFCMMAYGFTEEDICFYSQKEAIFEPLKEFLRKRNQGKVKDMESIAIDKEWLQSMANERTDYFEGKFERKDVLKESSENLDIDKHNIQVSAEETDERLWEESFKYPVMTGILHQEDAKKLLQLFPTGKISVKGLDRSYQWTVLEKQDGKNEVLMTQTMQDTKSSYQKALQEIEADNKKREEEKKRLEEQKREVKQRRFERKQQEEQREQEKKELEQKRQQRKRIFIITALMMLLLLGWYLVNQGNGGTGKL